MPHKVDKLENPERLAQLKPLETLTKIGIHKSDIVCDIGAGSGIFTIPAATLTNNIVYAIDINENLLSFIYKKAQDRGLRNIKVIQPTEFQYDIPSDSVDLAILVTVFHEIEDKKSLLNEIRRILKKSGKLAFIEFHKKDTTIGPPISHRISIDDVKEICLENNFLDCINFDVGESFYCITFGVEK